MKLICILLIGLFLYAEGESRGQDVGRGKSSSAANPKLGRERRAVSEFRKHQMTVEQGRRIGELVRRFIDGRRSAMKLPPAKRSVEMKRCGTVCVTGIRQVLGDRKYRAYVKLQQAYGVKYRAVNGLEPKERAARKP